jgi:hypothetical protein
MNEQKQQATPEAGAVPAPIHLEDFIEAVTRGVTRALAAQEEVSGYLLREVSADRLRPVPPMTIGLIFPFPTTEPQRPRDGIGQTVEVHRIRQ